MSTVGVIEAVFFTASDAYKKDPAGTFKGVVDILHDTPGLVGSVYHGLVHENPDDGVLFVPWTSYEAHQALINSSRYPELLEHFKKAIGGEMKMVHFKATGDTPASLGAGATEVARFTVKPGVAVADATVLLEQVAGFRVPGVSGTVWGYTVEDEREAVVAAGWSSIEVHQEAMKGSSPEAAAFVEKLLAVLEIKMVHVKFGKY
ncbi:hypothetical protein DENSPDRAFT_838158 [Dentipellis sp. KUC8613]|nr:hypothetical protein DENSPDRAFT_838158 [Dentipellis sp. KUC8613]